MIEIQCLKEYMLRMGIFALISHFAYCFAFGINMVPFSTGIFNQTSVMYPLFVAILVMWMKDSDLQMKNWVKKVLIAVLILSAFPADWRCACNIGNVQKERQFKGSDEGNVLVCCHIFGGIFPVCEQRLCPCTDRSSSHLHSWGHQSAVLARGYEMFLSKHVPLEK